MQNEEKCRDGKDKEQRETSPMWGLFTDTYDTEVIVKATFEETYITISLSSSVELGTPPRWKMLTLG